MGFHILALVLITASIAILSPCTPGRTDPQTGRVRVLYVGQWYFGGKPLYLVEDPLLRTSIVPYHDFGAQLDQIRRYMHLRYPRTKGHMTDSYDMVIFSNIQLLAFTPRQIQMAAEAVLEDGLGYMMSGGHTSFGGTTDSYPSWEGSWIGEILPVGLIDGQYMKPYYFDLVVTDAENELMASLPWSAIPPFSYSLNAVTVRQGGQLLAKTRVDGWPILAYGDFGKGRTLAFMTPFMDSDLDNYNMREWGYFEDLCANIAYYGAGIDLPDDHVTVHELRKLFRSYHDHALLFLSMVEFIDRFGVSTGPLEDMLEEVEGIRASSYEAYISQEYGESSRLMRDALEGLKEGSGRAVEIKNRALLWVYVIEYLVVTATLMVTGSLVWTLMVRRRLYRDVASTRMVG
jgi:uncharacterized membrane protein